MIENISFFLIIYISLYFFNRFEESQEYKICYSKIIDRVTSKWLICILDKIKRELIL